MIGPNGSSTVTTAQLNQIYWAVDYIADLEDQDQTLVIEMAQAMLNDLIEGHDLKPMIDYVKRYCDVIGSAEEAEQLAADISG
jgi:transcription initiation factor TFIIIB Brf1 subunit/transcription initiation factor TFIIB